MKKMLIIDNNPKFIGDLQAKLASRYDILATDDCKVAYQILNKTQIELMIANMSSNKNEKLIQLLKKLKNKKFVNTQKILNVHQTESQDINELKKLDLAAIIFNNKGIEMIVNEF